MPTSLTGITEITTALGMLAPNLDAGTVVKPDRLHNVGEAAWTRLVDSYRAREHLDSFRTAFANGRAFLHADDALRGRYPKRVEWKGPHRPPGDDVIPADIRIDHVYQVSCKYLSKIMLNAGPSRLFDRLLVGEERSSTNWFEAVAPGEYQDFYDEVRRHVGSNLPVCASDLAQPDRAVIKESLKGRTLPASLRPNWISLSRAVSEASAARWRRRLTSPRTRLRLLWRLLRIADAPYFVLGTAGTTHIRLRVASAWDWVQAYDLCSFDIAPRNAGQPEVGWDALVSDRVHGSKVHVQGHVEIRWSHGRFGGSPEAKVYLDTPHLGVPGFFPLE